MNNWRDRLDTTGAIIGFVVTVLLIAACLTVMR